MKGTSFPIRYISLAESRESQLIRCYLRQRPDAEELSKAKLFRERSAAFRRKYIRFMGQLNKENHSLHWWAMPFTNKNPLATTLCRTTAYVLATADLARCDPRPLVVITDNQDLAGQVAFWAKKEGLQSVNLARAPGATRRFLKRYTPAGTVRAAFRTFLLWHLSRRYKPARNQRDGHTVITTLTHPSCFVPPNGYRDAYFGRLVEQDVALEFKPLVLAMLVGRPYQQLRKLRRVKFPVSIVPLEACLTLGSLTACTLRSLGVFLRPSRLRGEMKIDGVDLSYLINKTVHEARRSGDLFLNLRVYYCAKWLSQNIRIARCLYPFENRAWEKMLLLGMRHGSPEPQLVGYQHASLTMSHTNFMFGPGEAEVTPLPDSILTTGGIITRWLEAEGNYPPGIFKTACALRQSMPVPSPSRTDGPTTRVLVALASSVQEYVETLSFLEKALVGKNCLEVRIRPHPEFSLASALTLAPLADSDFFSESTGPLAEDLRWADVVLYASSTVGLEAVSMGIPAVYLDLGSFLDTDPMSGWNEFRWSVKEPSELVATIQTIKDLPETRFLALQQKGREYVTDYLRPVTANSLATFWEA
jgi:hypothetical protein